LPWCAVDGALVAHIAKAAIATLGNGDHLTGLEQLKQQLARFRIRNDGPHGHFERDVIPGGTEHVRTHAMLTALGIVPAREAVIDQGIEVGVGHRKHMAATATVATVGTAKLFVFFMPKRDAASATISSGDVNVGFVNEFHVFDRLGTELVRFA